MGNSSSSSSSRSGSSTYSGPRPGHYVAGPSYPPQAYPQAPPQAPPPPLQQSTTFRFRSILDNFSTLEQVQDALRKEGLESSNLIIAVDFTKSNEWTGKHSFGGRSLHSITAEPNPYEEAITIIGKTLRAFDDDNLIPCYGFGDATTRDEGVFSFFPGDRPCQGLESVVWRYRELCPYIRLAGPTSFAGAINQAAKVVSESGNQFHILVIVADGQVTRPSDTPDGGISTQEAATIKAICDASHLPLSIIMVGVGDGPWDVMKHFDDAIPQRQFDNFQFVNYTQIARQYADQQKREALFALRALMEIPEQYKLIQRLGLLDRRSGYRPPSVPRPLDPPGPAPTLPPPQHMPQAAQCNHDHMQNGGASTSAGGSAAQDSLFVCPITQEMMVDPVIAADGYSYERSAIELWLRTKDTSPMSNAKLQHKNVIPNHALRSAIMEKQEHTK